MDVCSLCENLYGGEYYNIETFEGEKRLCRQCFSVHRSVLTKWQPQYLEICYVPGCQNYASHREYLCHAHSSNANIEESCIRCGDMIFDLTVFDNLCDFCRCVEHNQHIKDYRAIGTHAEIHAAFSELNDYRALGSYEELADLVSRKDIYEHIEELNENGKIILT
jgi:hypothetical protein